MIETNEKVSAIVNEIREYGKGNHDDYNYSCRVLWNYEQIVENIQKELSFNLI